MHHILLAVDGSDWSLVAARHALDFARAFRQDVVALAVIPPEIMRVLDESPETLAYSPRIPAGEQLGHRAVNDWFAATEAACEEAGLCFTRFLDVGKPAERLVWHSITPRLTVLGAHGVNAPAHGRGLGKTAAYVLRNSIKPMLITQGEYRPVRKVVLGWNGHSPAAHAAEMISVLGRAYNWKVYVVSGAEAVSRLAQSCAHIADHMVNEGLDAESYITPGNAPDVIFQAIERFKPDLVAIGGRRESVGGSRIFTGAALQIVEQVDIPVLLYR